MWRSYSTVATDWDVPRPFELITQKTEEEKFSFLIEILKLVQINVSEMRD